MDTRRAILLERSWLAWPAIAPKGAVVVYQSLASHDPDRGFPFFLRVPSTLVSRRSSFDPILEATGAASFVLAGSQQWTTELTLALRTGGRIAVGFDRPAVRRLLGSAPPRTLNAKAVRHRLHVLDARVTARYAVWPSLHAPRLIYSSRITGWWLQRTGIIGGGGGSSRRQRLARSLVAAPVIAVVAPSWIWVVER